jgi:ribosomal protein S12 methylthiotransferase accessory factor
MTVEMEIGFPGGARVDAAFGDFVIKTDQYPHGGGEGSAPTPFALFLASMGTCAGIYILNFCRQRNIPTENIRIRQSIEFDPETRLARQVNLDILLPPDFPRKYASALINSAKLCAVKKHLESPPAFKIETHVVEG